MSRLTRAAVVVADLAGRSVRSLPGYAGAILVSYGAAGLTHRPAAGLLVGGLFLLIFDARRG